MAEKNTAMAFITDFLRENPQAEYKDIAKAADEQGFKIYPIMYGRAKSLLGLIPEGGGRTRRAKRAAEEQAQGRKLKQGRGARHSEMALNELSGFVEKFRDLEEERNRYRAALINVEKILRNALRE